MLPNAEEIELIFWIKKLISDVFSQKWWYKIWYNYIYVYIKWI